MFLKDCEMLLVRDLGNPERGRKVAAPYTSVRRVSVDDLSYSVTHITTGKFLLRSGDKK